MSRLSACQGQETPLLDEWFVPDPCSSNPGSLGQRFPLIIHWGVLTMLRHSTPECTQTWNFLHPEFASVAIHMCPYIWNSVCSIGIPGSSNTRAIDVTANNDSLRKELCPCQRTRSKGIIFNSGWCDDYIQQSLISSLDPKRQMSLSEVVCFCHPHRLSHGIWHTLFSLLIIHASSFPGLVWDLPGPASPEAVTQTGKAGYLGWLDEGDRWWAQGRRGERKGNLWCLWVAGFPPLAQF